MVRVAGEDVKAFEVPVAKDRPITVQQVLATLYHSLGVDPATTLNNISGRPMYLLDDRTPISELI